MCESSATIPVEITLSKVMHVVANDPQPGTAKAQLSIAGNVPTPFVVPLQHTVSIGRAKENYVVFPDNSRVSRFHALIRCDDGAGSYQIVDLGSRNGTSVDGVLVVTPRQLANGARIEIGDITLEFQARTMPAHETPVIAGPRIGAKRAACVMVASLDTFPNATTALEEAERARWLGSFFRRIGHLITSGQGWLDKFRGAAVMSYWQERESRPSCAHLAMDAALQILRETPEIEPPFGRLSRSGITLHFGPVEFSSDKILPGEALRGETVNTVFEVDRLRRQEGLPFLLTEPCLASLPDKHLLRLNDMGLLRYGSRGRSIRVFGLAKA